MPASQTPLSPPASPPAPAPPAPAPASRTPTRTAPVPCDPPIGESFTIRDRIIHAALWGALFVVPCVISTDHMNAFLDPKNALVGLVAVVMAAAFLIDGLIRGELALPRLWPLPVVGALVVWMALSLLWARGVPLAARDLGFQAAWLTIFAVAAITVSTRARIEALVDAALAGGCAVAGFGLLQYYGLDAPILTRLSRALFVPGPQAPTGLLPWVFGPDKGAVIHGWIDPMALILPLPPGEPSKIYSFLGYRGYVAAYLTALVPLIVTRLAIEIEEFRRTGRQEATEAPIRGGTGRLPALVLPPAIPLGAEWVKHGLASLGVLAGLVLVIRVRPLVRRVIFRSAMLVLLATAIVLTGECTAWIALLLGLGFLIGAVHRRDARPNHRWVQSVALALVPLVLVGLLLGWRSVAICGRSVENPLHHEQVSALDRLATCTLWLTSPTAGMRRLILRSTLSIIGDGRMHACIGTGIGTFSLHYMEYQARLLALPENRELVPYANKSVYAFNEVLHYWSELGLVGVLLLGAAGILFIRHLVAAPRRRPIDRDLIFQIGLLACLATILAHAALAFDLHLAPTAVLFGTMAAFALRFDPCPIVRHSLRRPVRWIALGLTLAAACVVCRRLDDALAQSHHWWLANRRFRWGQFDPAIAELLAASRLAGEKGEILYDLGRALMDSGRDALAIEAFRMSDATFVDPATFLNIAICHSKESTRAAKDGRQAEAGDLLAQAREEYAQARKLGFDIISSVPYFEAPRRADGPAKP